MARLTITNNKEKFHQDIELNKKAGLEDYQIIRNNGIYLVVYKKRIIKTDNLIKFENGDFVSAVGTIIYKEHFAAKALEHLYWDFDENIKKIREYSIGNYCICIKKSERIYCFTDKYNVINVYYYKNNDDWFLTNSLANVLHSRNQVDINEYPFIEEVFQVGGIGRNTIVKGVVQLVGNDHVLIDGYNSFTIIAKEYQRRKWNHKGQKIDVLAQEYARKIKKYTNLIVKHFGENIRIQQTGGLDSRTIAAAVLSQGCIPKTMYGVGNSLLTNTKKEDLDFNKVFATMYDIDFYEMDWRTNLKEDIRKWKDLFNKFGFHYIKYGGGQKHFTEYDGQIPNYPDLILTGLYGEFLRLREWADEQDSEYLDFDSIVSNYFIKRSGLNDMVYTNLVSYKSYYKELLIEYSKEYDIPVQNNEVHIDSFDHLRELRAREGDSSLINFLNEYTHSLLLFSIDELYEYTFDLPASYRRNAKFQIKVIKHLYDKILELPLFAHCRECAINNDDEVIEIIKKNKATLFKYKYPSIYDFAKSIYRSFKPKEHDIIRETMTKLIYKDLA